MATERQQETSVPLYSVSSEQSRADSYNSNRPMQDEFLFRSSSPDTSADYSGSIDVNSQQSAGGDSNSNAYNLGSIFNKKKFAWLLEVDDTGDDDDDMDKPLL